MEREEGGERGEVKRVRSVNRSARAGFCSICGITA